MSSKKLTFQQAANIISLSAKSIKIIVTNSNSERRIIDDCIRIFHKKQISDFNEIDLATFRFFVKEIKEFGLIQKEIIDDLIRTFQYMEVKEGTCIMEKEEKADVVILLRGELTLKRYHTMPKKRELVLDQCFTTVGDLTMIEGPSWKYDSIYASKNSAVILIDNEMMMNIARKYELLKAKREKFEFIIPCLPHLNKYSQGSQRKAVDFFIERKFKTGNEIIIENSQVENAYLIKSGECEIKIHKHPFDNYGKMNEGYDQDKIIGLMKRGGYNSETVSNFNIGRLAPKQWFGEESVLLGHDTYMYSIIAASQVILYEISKEKIGLLPLEVKGSMIQSAKNKLNWLQDRKNQVTDAYTQIFCMNEDRKINMARDGIQNKTKELNDIVESFPKATGQALEKIKTRKERLKSADITKKREQEKVLSMNNIAPLSPKNASDPADKPGIKPSRPQTAVTRISKSGDETFKFPVSPRTFFDRRKSENESPSQSPDRTQIQAKPPENEPVNGKQIVYKSGYGLKVEPRIYLSIFKKETASRTYRTQKNKLIESQKIGKSRTPSPEPQQRSKSRSRSPTNTQINTANNTITLKNTTLTHTNTTNSVQPSSRPKSGVVKDLKAIRTDDDGLYWNTGTGTAETLISPKGRTHHSQKSMNETLGTKGIRNSIGMVIPATSKYRSSIVGSDPKRPLTASMSRLNKPEDKTSSIVFKEQTIDGFGLLGIKNHRRFMMSSIFKPAEIRGYITAPNTPKVNVK